jgi:hypothetical protein
MRVTGARIGAESRVVPFRSRFAPKTSIPTWAREILMVELAATGSVAAIGPTRFECRSRRSESRPFAARKVGHLRADGALEMLIDWIEDSVLAILLQYVGQCRIEFEARAYLRDAAPIIQRLTDFGLSSASR